MRRKLLSVWPAPWRRMALVAVVSVVAVVAVVALARFFAHAPLSTEAGSHAKATTASRSVDGRPSSWPHTAENKPLICMLGNAETVDRAVRAHQMWARRFPSFWYVWNDPDTIAPASLSGSLSIVERAPSKQAAKSFAQGMATALNRAQKDRSKLPCDYYFTHDDDLTFTLHPLWEEKLRTATPIIAERDIDQLAALAHAARQVPSIPQHQQQQERGSPGSLSSADRAEAMARAGVLELLLSAYAPAVASFPWLVGLERSPEMAAIFSAYADAPIAPLTGFDNGMVIYHNDVVDFFIPYAPRGEGGLSGNWTLGAHFLQLFAPHVFKQHAHVITAIQYSNNINLDNGPQHKRRVKKGNLYYHQGVRHPYEYALNAAYIELLSEGITQLDPLVRIGKDIPLSAVLKPVTRRSCTHEGQHAPQPSRRAARDQRNNAPKSIFHVLGLEPAPEEASHKEFIGLESENRADHSTGDDNGKHQLFTHYEPTWVVAQLAAFYDPYATALASNAYLKRHQKLVAAVMEQQHRQYQLQRGVGTHDDEKAAEGADAGTGSQFFAVTIEIHMFAFERIDRFKQLWADLSQSVLPSEHPARVIYRIIIHYDNHDFEHVDYFLSLRSRVGSVEVRARVEHAGLLTSVLECCFTTSEHTYFLLLEDDLRLSPYALLFAWVALKHEWYAHSQEPTAMHQQRRVIGVSLYAQLFSEVAEDFLHFPSIFDGDSSLQEAPTRLGNNGVGMLLRGFYWQQPQSWGALYKGSAWTQFVKWYRVQHARTEEAIKEQESALAKEAKDAAIELTRAREEEQRQQASGDNGRMKLSHDTSTILLRNAIFKAFRTLSHKGPHSAASHVYPCSFTNRWPHATSWKKALLKYMVLNDLYMLYPALPHRYSFSVNTLGVGVNDRESKASASSQRKKLEERLLLQRLTAESFEARSEGSAAVEKKGEGAHPHLSHIFSSKGVETWLEQSMRQLTFDGDDEKGTRRLLPHLASTDVVYHEAASHSKYEKGKPVLPFQIGPAFGKLMPRDCQTPSARASLASADSNELTSFERCTIVVRVPPGAAASHVLSTYFSTVIASLAQRFRYAGDIVLVGNSDDIAHFSSLQKVAISATRKGNIHAVPRLRASAGEANMADWFFNNDVVEQVGRLPWSCILLYDPLFFEITLEDLAYAVETWQGHFFDTLIGFSDLSLDHFRVKDTGDTRAGTGPRGSSPVYGLKYGSFETRKREGKAGTLVYPGLLALARDRFEAGFSAVGAFVEKQPHCAAAALNAYMQLSRATHERIYTPEGAPTHRCPMLLQLTSKPTIRSSNSGRAIREDGTSASAHMAMQADTQAMFERMRMGLREEGRFETLSESAAKRNNSPSGGLSFSAHSVLISFLDFASYAAEKAVTDQEAQCLNAVLSEPDLRWFPPTLRSLSSQEDKTAADNGSTLDRNESVPKLYASIRSADPSRNYGSSTTLAGRAFHTCVYR